MRRDCPAHTAEPVFRCVTIGCAPRTRQIAIAIIAKCCDPRLGVLIKPVVGVGAGIRVTALIYLYYY